MTPLKWRCGFGRFASAAALCIPSAAGWAFSTPRPCGSDLHVQCAIYDRNEVYQVATTRGKTVLLQFEDGESVADNGVGVGGEPKAWAGGMGANWFFLQPNRANADTNLVIVTNRRTYTLALVTAAKDTPATWVLRFSYPEAQAKAEREQASKAQRNKALGAQAAQNAEPRNEAYLMRGDEALAPTALWDDSRFTYFRYASGRDLPRLFQVLPDGSEAQSNFHMEGDTVVVHAVAKAFVIRLGNAVLAIRNDGFADDVGQYNAAGTTVPGVVRVTKESNEGGSQ